MTVTAPAFPLRNPLNAMQAEVVPALAALLDGVCPVFDHVPEDAEAPYVVWNSAWPAARNALRTPITRVWVQIDVWSTYRGFGEAGRIADRIVERLDHALILMDGWKTVHLFFEQGHAIRDPDPRYRRLALTFHSPYVSPQPSPEEG